MYFIFYKKNSVPEYLIKHLYPIMKSTKVGELLPLIQMNGKEINIDDVPSMLKDANNIGHTFIGIESLEEREDTNENKLSFNSKNNVYANDSKNSLSIQKKKKRR